MRSIKLALLLTLMMLLVPPVFAQDAKLTALPDLPNPTVDDILYVVDDPGGSPAQKRATILSVVNAVLASQIVTDDKWYDVAACNDTTAGAVLDIPTSGGASAACD